MDLSLGRTVVLVMRMLKVQISGLGCKGVAVCKCIALARPGLCGEPFALWVCYRFQIDQNISGIEESMQ